MTEIKSFKMLAFIAQFLPHNPVIVEAGGFLGHDSVKMITQWPGATIHVFEPVPALFEQMCQRIQMYPTIKPYNIALSNAVGTAPLYVAHKPTKAIPTQASSLHAPKERLSWSAIEYPYTITVPTITLDAWAQQNNVEHIDLLWLDLQGHELAALQGAETILGNVNVVHTEVSFVHAYEGQPLYHEVIAWMQEHNFVPVAKDFANTTDWFFGNMLFIKKESCL